MNASNSSVESLSDKVWDAASVQVTIYLGLVIFLENLTLVAIIFKLSPKCGTKKETNDFIVHTLFVCVNDMCSGFTLCMLGLIRVTSYTTAYLCAYTLCMSLSLQLMSQGNITCICVQRYIGARNIRSLTQGRPRYRTLTLMLVNVLICGGSLVSSIAQSYKSVAYINESTDHCSFSDIMGGKAPSIAIVFYNIGILFTIFADILCLLTIRKLQVEINGVVQPENSTKVTWADSKSTSTAANCKPTSDKVSNGNSSLSNTGTGVDARTSIKVRQQRAIFTLLFILITFNVSVLPAISVYIKVIVGRRMTFAGTRFVYVTLFLNSFVNPIIIGTRVQEIRQALRDAVRTAFKFVFRC